MPKDHKKDHKKKDHRKKGPKEKGPGDPKQYELNVYHKRSAQLSRDIYMLPLDIKLIIFALAMNSNMIKWQKCHKTSTRAWYGIKTRYKPFSWLDLIKGWGSQAPKNKFFPYVHDPETGDFRGSIPDEYKIKLCSDKNVIIEEDGRRYFTLRVVSIVHLRGGIVPVRSPLYFSPVWEQDHARQIRGRKTSKDNSYWFHKRCRCLTCDLIRVYAVDSGHRRLGSRQSDGTNDKYRHIDYMGKGQWTSHTEAHGTLTNKGKKMLRNS